jgi:hypothetical protein
MLEPIPFAGYMEIDINNEPVAWAMFKDNTFMDAIHPDEHTRFEGGYTIPLYTHPVKELTDEEIEELAEYHGIDSLYETGRLDFARAILRKAQEK